MLSGIKNRAGRPLKGFILALSLVRRDYAVQFAGTALGIVWLVVQYVFQIAIFYLVFGILLASPDAPRRITSGSSDYLLFLLGGMCLWLPAQDMLLRSCGILADNRALIRRTAVGAGYFVWVPVLEGMLHYLIIILPVLFVGVLRGGLSWYFPLAVAVGLGTILSLSGWAFVLARTGVILKDLSPLMRLVFQVLFWGTPIVYPATEKTLWLFQWNPAFVLIELHRALLFNLSDSMLAQIPVLNGLSVFLLLSLPAYYISSRRLGVAVADHI